MTILESNNTGGGGGGGGSVTVGQATVDFTSTPSQQASVVVLDAGVSAGSKFTLGIRVASGRDADELELSPLNVAVTNISAGVNFTVSAFVAEAAAYADGQFLIDYVRS